MEQELVAGFAQMNPKGKEFNDNGLRDTYQIREFFSHRNSTETEN